MDVETDNIYWQPINFFVYMYTSHIALNVLQLEDSFLTDQFLLYIEIEIIC